MLGRVQLQITVWHTSSRAYWQTQHHHVIVCVSLVTPTGSAVCCQSVLVVSITPTSAWTQRGADAEEKIRVDISATPIESILEASLSCCQSPPDSIGHYPCSQRCSNTNVHTGEDGGIMSASPNWSRWPSWATLVNNNAVCCQVIVT